MPTLLSLFDYSGTWSAPFRKAGWEVIQVDLKFDEGYDDGLSDIATWDSVEYIMEDLGIQEVDGIICAPPCTKFTSAGARWWDSCSPEELQGYVHLVEQCMRIVDLFRPTDPTWAEEMPEQPFFWAIENPVGRIAKLVPGMELEASNRLYWHPWMYAGRTTSKANMARLDTIRRKDGVGVTQEESDLILKCGAYTKATMLWGEFRSPVTMNVPAVKACAAGSPLMRLGGKSDKTKAERSNTPAGFAQAFFEANHNFNCMLEPGANERFWGRPCGAEAGIDDED